MADDNKLKPKLTKYVFNLVTGKATMEKIGENYVEFPIIDLDT